MNNNDNDNIVIPADAFIRSIGINKTIPHLFFLGSGASISSGIPSAEQCTWEWKRDIFLSNNPGLKDQFSEISLMSVRQRIQTWLDLQGKYPNDNQPEEYSFYIENCYPIPNDRRAFFQEKVRLAVPNIGYRLLCLLAQSDLVRAVWTTNFDTLAARAATSFKLIPIEVGVDSQHRLIRNSQKGELLCVSMHGDFRYDHLKNTTNELQQQEELLKNELIRQLVQTPTIVVGYSGRDTSIIEAFERAYSQSGTGTLYWCGYKTSEPTQKILNLIKLARQSGHQAYYIPIESFDDLTYRIATHCCEGKQLEDVRSTVTNMASPTTNKRVPFTTNSAFHYTAIKSNAYKVECPSEVLTFELKQWPNEKVWSNVRDITKNHIISAVPFKGRILALGTIDDLKDVFQENIKGEIQRTPIIESELKYEDGAITSLLKEALTKGITKITGINSDSRSQLWDSTEIERVNDKSQVFLVYNSVIIHLRKIGLQEYLVLSPTLRIQNNKGELASVELDKSIKYRILSKQYNKQFCQSVSNWFAKLFPGKEEVRILEFPPNTASAFRFKINQYPIFAEIGTSIQWCPTKLPDNLKQLSRHSGFEMVEPQLLFSNKYGTSYTKDSHPIRGIINNRPYDFPLTQKGLASSIRIGIVCPKVETQELRKYLDISTRIIQPKQPDPEYLLVYPGFEKAYGLPLDIPEPQASGWVTCPEPTTNNPFTGPRELAKCIIQSIDSLLSSYNPQEILIFFPKRWASLRGYRTKDERFDIHDFVKAYCVQKGVPTQFLEGDTLSYEDQCSVWWWLSLAFYAKSMRTPWVLESIEADTAFVGLGFSVDRFSPRGQNIVLGCSHIYSSRGEGLQFRLSKVENPIFHGKNAFMSEEDARRLGETIRQLFFDAKSKLPQRVVIHKQTPFIREEREGLLEGLNGVKNVEMLEIRIDHALRYTALSYYNNVFDDDIYPVRRGTTVKLDDFTSLVYVHGVTAALNPRHRYFQGRRRIPAPLIVHRHMGESDLRVIAQELLGLSKMNWNTFDMYTKIPATIQSSSEIARIGSLLQRFGPQSYDFRLFM